MTQKLGMIQINEKLTGDFERTLYGADSFVKHIFIFPTTMDAFSKTHGICMRSSLIKLN